MRSLKNILQDVPVESVVGSIDRSVSNIQYDSRSVEQDTIFVAIKGGVFDGHAFISKAIDQGAVVVVCENLPEILDAEITYVKVKSTARALALMASNYYQNPSENLKLIGITGTNGKTTVATLLYELFKLAGYKVGLISTVKIMVDEQEFSTTHTTPDSLVINSYLSQMNTQGIEFCFMEVSSHGIHQHRTEGLLFDGGVFTNLSHDHLDYHASFAEYRDVKKSFFDQLPSTAFALVNADDKNGSVMLQNTKAKQSTYALKSYADYRVQILENQFSGLLLKMNDQEVSTQLIGSFNAYNLAAIYGVADLLGIEKSEILRHLSLVTNVSGRFQYFTTPLEVTVIVDYAHTPDALKNVLETINAIRTKNQTLITVVGCGGDRDKTKRPKMGHIASALSSKVFFTSDNPRSEKPEQIIVEMEAGVQPQNLDKITSIKDRKEAITAACKQARSHDIILIAGKGHEVYQEVKGVKHEFNDSKLSQAILIGLEQ
ncbi:UDP-N-acetylmuramoyl-L-alanyl-D-glutamate--2,6-diaminopimelate ligase [Flavobacteriaceae bacterium]|jgi:UDP-N-acetylmuramoyl-L-alanyl-D-glutamate--2,6-diaminopimelate ligase|nr:UDP-N-acetylmuramoyl-L-alanyl-D-glutamate--2,6-diaminopimelate ligase [Flavobacteriaceae bacterium]MDA7728307.1 UDP-N-acetylmuramoyl-L-alanyl-D-glutamate--2,6-diaminopimelate ligase [Flavobacteriaceae bacterium]MDA7849261.1 UDP-N-acetylmuramoyl-L-alanyl-D-glutamate--2,6-diaminopimelate ligase [Flavobacteriaceae bacterium]